MIRTIQIGDKDVEMLAVASTDIYYRQIFGIDPLKEQTAKTFSASDLVVLMERMAFVMMKQAELKDRKAMINVSYDDYLDWMDSIERKDLLEAVPQIRQVYEGQRMTSVKEKKRADQ